VRHGTAVAGVAAAGYVPGAPMMGVAPEAEIGAYKVSHVGEKAVASVVRPVTWFWLQTLTVDRQSAPSLWRSGAQAYHCCTNLVNRGLVLQHCWQVHACHEPLCWASNSSLCALVCSDFKCMCSLCWAYVVFFGGVWLPATVQEWHLSQCCWPLHHIQSIPFSKSIDPVPNFCFPPMSLFHSLVSGACNLM
jgi:hypothetical protein